MKISGKIQILENLINEFGNIKIVDLLNILENKAA